MNKLWETMEGKDSHANGNSSAKFQDEMEKGRYCDPFETSLVPSTSNLDGPFMMPLLPVPNASQSNSKAFIILTGTATRGGTVPAIGAVDIGVSKSAYFFQVALPGVRKDPGQFSCEIERDGKVHVREKGTVCVTGAGGYVASWLVKLLLSNGYSIHGTHLSLLLTNWGSMWHVTWGSCWHFSCICDSKVNPQVQLIEPAVKGTLNVLKACSEANVKRVVVVSSGAAVSLNPEWPKGQVKDETCWSDAEYCKRTNNWYCLSKTKAESEAFEYAKRSGLDVVRVCPTHVLGPMLQSTANASSLVLIKLSKEGYDEFENNLRMIVDVRDVAEALLLAYEKPEAEGRYICTAYMIKSQGLVEILRKNYPNYNYPKKFTEGKEEEKLSSEKLQKLGWSYRPIEETLVDSIEICRLAGLLD
ncbi:unnamed protein product [Camellia sinensis]